MIKPVVHFEIGCNNLSETVEFYKDVFNRTIFTKDSSASIDTDKKSGISGHITELEHDLRKDINIYIETETIAHDLKLIVS